MAKTKLERRIIAADEEHWSKPAGVLGKLDKVLEEFLELTIACFEYEMRPTAETRRAVAYEAADVAICLVALVGRLGLSLWTTMAVKWAHTELRIAGGCEYGSAEVACCGASLSDVSGRHAVLALQGMPRRGVVEERMDPHGLSYKEMALLDTARAGLLRKMANEGPQGPRSRNRLPRVVSILETLRELKRRGVTVVDAAGWCKKFNVHGQEYEPVQMRLPF